jgi:hypothetical protein
MCVVEEAVLRRFAVVSSVSVAILLVVAWAALGRGPSSALTASVLTRLAAASDREHKATLIEQLAAPPQVVILGGSRALRYEPAYIRERTGLSAFNAAVTGARPEDAWAFANLLHARFPAARLSFLWVIHADEFDRKALDPGLLSDPSLAHFFPPALIRSQMRRERLHPAVDRMQMARVFAPDGHVIHDVFDLLFPRPGADAAGIRNNIRCALSNWATTPAQLAPRSVLYFTKTLALIESIAAAPPIIVAAPVDSRILAATTNRGWGMRHRLVLQFLAGLHSRYRFLFVDFSKAEMCGCTASDFFDGIHLRPSGTRKVVDAVLRRFPEAFGGRGPLKPA